MNGEKQNKLRGMIMTNRKILTVLVLILVIINLFSCVFAESEITTVEMITLPSRNSLAYFEGPGWNTGAGEYAPVKDSYGFIHRSTMKTFLDSNGILTSGITGAKYNFSTVLKADHKEYGAKITTSAAYTVNLGTGTFTSVNFVATSRGKSGTDINAATDISNYKVTITYDDQTTEEKSFTIFGYKTENSQIVASPKLIYGTNSSVTNEIFNMYEYCIPIDTEKKAISLTFNANQAPITVFAVSSVYNPIEFIESKIKKLPESLTAENISETQKMLSDISELLDKFTEAGGDKSKITNLEKYTELKSEFPSVENISFSNDKIFVTVNVMFDSVVNENSVNAYIVEVEDKIEAVEKSFTISNEKTAVELKFKHYRNYNKTYSFVIEKGVENVDTGLVMIENFSKEINLQAPFEVSDFKIIKTADNSAVESLEDLGNTEIKVSAELANINVSEGQSYIVIMGLYGSNNELMDCKINVGSLAKGTEPKPEEWILTLPQDVDENYNIRYFVIDSDGKTLYNPMSLK